MPAQRLAAISRQLRDLDSALSAKGDERLHHLLMSADDLVTDARRRYEEEGQGATRDACPITPPDATVLPMPFTRGAGLAHAIRIAKTGGIAVAFAGAALAYRVQYLQHAEHLQAVSGLLL